MRVSGVIAVALAIFPAVSARAADPVLQRFDSPDWTITIGIEPRVLPNYEGSSNYRMLPFPLFDIRPAGTPARFRGPRDGASIGILETDQFRIGPTLKLRLPRHEDASTQGLGDVAWAWEAGLFAEYWPTKFLRGRIELRRGFGGHHGFVADVMGDVVVPVTQQLTLSGGPRVTFSDTKAMAPYYTVTPEQSALSGLPAYDARGGLRSYGAGVQARYEWSPRWATHIFFEYERLAGDAANAPLVTMRGSRDQMQVGMGVTYSFDWSTRR